MAHVNDQSVIDRLMRTPGTWAVVGLSTNEWRPAFGVSLFVRDTLGMRIIPVNLPGADVHGETGYRSLADIAVAEHPLDVVECFVNSSRVGAIIDQAIAVGARAIWLQLGVFDDAAVDRAKAAGLDVVVNACPAQEGWRMGLR